MIGNESRLGKTDHKQIECCSTIHCVLGPSFITAGYSACEDSASQIGPPTGHPNAITPAVTANCVRLLPFFHVTINARLTCLARFVGDV